MSEDQEYLDISSLEKKRVRAGKKIYSKRGGRVKINVTIPYELYQELITTAPKAFGIGRGSLSYAVEAAIRLWLGRVEGGSYTHTERGGGSEPKTTSRKGADIHFIKIMKSLDYRDFPDEIPQSVLENAIVKEMGVQAGSHAVYRWLETFRTMGYIEPVDVTINKTSDWKNNTRIRFNKDSIDGLGLGIRWRTGPLREVAEISGDEREAVITILNIMKTLGSSDIPHGVPLAPVKGIIDEDKIHKLYNMGLASPEGSVEGDERAEPGVVGILFRRDRVEELIGRIYRAVLKSISHRYPSGQVMGSVPMSYIAEGIRGTLGDSMADEDIHYLTHLFYKIGLVEPPKGVEGISGWSDIAVVGVKRAQEGG